jgi:hypothetical protein
MKEEDNEDSETYRRHTERYIGESVKKKPE